MSQAARPLATVSANAVPRPARLSADAAASEVGVQRSRENCLAVMYLVPLFHFQFSNRVIEKLRRTLETA
jgi:hypothetical protein